MKDKETKGHVLSIRITPSDLEAVEKIAELNHEKTPQTARRALEMLIRAYSGVLEEPKGTKKDWMSLPLGND